MNLARDSSPKIVLATIDLSFHRAAAGVVQAILEKHGVVVQEIRAPHETAFEALASGRADMLCSAWLPGSHGVYFDPIAYLFEKLTVLYTPYALWGVPGYVYEAGVHSVADLARPEVHSRMNKLIQGIGAGAGISRFSVEIIDHYGLSGLGYHFRNGSLEACVRAYESAESKGEWVVVPLWQPQYLFHDHDIRELDEPNGLLRGRDDATLIARTTSLAGLPSAAVAELRATTLGNEVATTLDFELSRGGLTPLELGKRYLAAGT